MYSDLMSANGDADAGMH